MLTEFGTRIKIKDLPNFKGWKVKTHTKGSIVDSEVLAWMERPIGSRKIFRLKTKLGYELMGSSDHPIMAENGFKKVGELKIGDKIAVSGFIGVPYEVQEEFLILDENLLKLDLFYEKKKIIDQLKKLKLLPLYSTNEKLPLILRLMGYLFGDGSISLEGRKRSAMISFYSKNTEDLKKIKEDLEKLGFKATIYEKKKMVYTTSNALACYFISLGVPFGKKACKDFYVPGWLFKLKPWMKRIFLASYFGAELSKPVFIKRKPIEPHLPLVKEKKHKESGLKFLDGIRKLLKEFGVDSKIRETEEKGKVRLELVIFNEEKNLLNLWSKVGYEYNREREKLGGLAALYLKIKYLSRMQRFIKRRKIKVSAESPAKLSKKLGVNLKFVENTKYLGCKNAYVGRNIPYYSRFINSFNPVYYDEIVEKSEIKTQPSEKVYDLMVSSKTHTFFANGILVHNCGVRLLRTNLDEKNVRPKLKQLLEVIFRNVPSGVGRGGKVKLSSEKIREVLKYGARWAVENGYGWDKDLEHIEDKGNEEKYARPEKVSEKAVKRGAPQLGSLGAGNHFLEIQKVDKIFLPEAAKVFGITHEGQITVMIHTGSRGLGHQVATDYLQLMERKFKEQLKRLPDRELAFAPSGTKLFDDYFGAMNAAANFAFANRQMITHWVRESFGNVFKQDPEELGLNLIYGITHNMAKLEEHEVDGKKMKLLVHRKGATRAFGPKWKDVPKDYKSVGQPVLIPGSMGTGSFILIGTDKAEKVTFSSIAHGAGRVKSRAKALREYRGEKVAKELQNRGILIRAASWRVVAEEAPGVYKNVDEVVKVCEEAGIAKIVARLKPIGVVKG